MEITASDTIKINSENSPNFTGVFSNVGREDASGDAGNVTISTANLHLTNGGQVSASTNGVGNAGDLTVSAEDTIKLDGSSPGGRSGLFVSAIQGNGKGGDMTVITDELNISNGATISASNFQSFNLVEPGTGEPGDIKIEANSLNLSNEARIEAATQAETGELTANINLEIADEIVLRDNSFISAQAFGEANGGNLTIDTNFIIAFPSKGDGNDIIASAKKQGGKISITAESVLGIEERSAFDNNGTNDIDASSGTEGLDGTVTISTPENNSLRETTELSDKVVSPELVTTSNVCSASDIEDVSTLAVQGKGGVAPEPTAPFDGDALILDGELETSNLVPNNDNFVDSNQIPPQIQPVAYKDNGEPIYIARGVIKQADGTVILTAYPVKLLTSRTPDPSFGCSE